MSPGFWVSPEKWVNYPVAVQTPEHRIGTVDDIMQTPITTASGVRPTLLLNLAKAERGTTSTVVSHYKIQPVFDVFANVQGRDLGGVMHDVEKTGCRCSEGPAAGKLTCIIRQDKPRVCNSAFFGLASGLAFALILVYLLLVINFQSWVDPLIILMALPRGVLRNSLGAFCNPNDVQCSSFDGSNRIHQQVWRQPIVILLITFRQ